MGFKIGELAKINQTRQDSISGQGAKASDKDIHTQAKEARAKQNQGADALKKEEAQIEIDKIDMQIADCTEKLGKCKEGSNEYLDLQAKLIDLGSQKTAAKGVLDNLTKALDTEVVSAAPKFSAEC